MARVSRSVDDGFYQNFGVGRLLKVDRKWKAFDMRPAGFSLYEAKSLWILRDRTENHFDVF